MADGYEMPSSARRHRPRTERGAVFVEFAMVLPLFMALVLGIYTGGLAYTNKISLVEAVREGARYGASLPVGTDPVTTWETGVRNRVVFASGGEVAFGDVCVKFVLPTGGSDCGITDPPGASNEPAVHLVKVSATKQAKIEFFFYTSEPLLRGQIVARFERDTG
ncbi:MAG: pilus assembly protein [Actinomycetota bacterium]|nr:pilus assembly protein [Actinomycetota bacterium]